MEKYYKYICEKCNTIVTVFNFYAISQKIEVIILILVTWNGQNENYNF